MADESPQEFFVERVVNVSHANGVFRMTFAQQSESDAVRPLVRLLIPANQLSSILQGISKAARDIGEQVQARRGSPNVNSAAVGDGGNKSKSKAKK